MAGEILLCAGYTADKNLIIQLYDVENDDWHSETIFSDIKWDDITYFKNKIYFIKRDLDFDADKFEVQIRSYDTKTTETKLTITRTTRYAGKTVGIYENYVYFLNILDRILTRYNLADNTIEENIASLKESHEENVAFLDGLLYIIGVRFSNYDQSDCTTYDTATNQLKAIAPHPALSENEEPRTDWRSYRISVTGFNGKLYTIEENSLGFLNIYDPESGEWQKIIVQNPPEVNRGVLTNCGGKLVCVDRNMNAFVFDSKTNEWETKRKYNGAMTHVIYANVINDPKIDDQ